MEIKSKRIGNLAFNKAGYLDDVAGMPAYAIVFYYPNEYYGKENEFLEDPSDSNYMLNPEKPHYKIPKSRFKFEEIDLILAVFEYDSHENYYEIRFTGDRPLQFLNTKELRETFFELLKYGNKQLEWIEDKED